MEKKLTLKQKLFVDELFLNNQNQTEAYVRSYGVTNRKYADMAASRLMTNDNVKLYFEHKMAEFREKLDITKEKMIDRMMQLDNVYQQMVALAGRDDLSVKEQEKLERLQKVVKGSDVAKNRDMLNKLAWGYSAEKSEITHKGEIPLFPDLTKKNEE